ncbi:tRNA 2-selenouridine(34) synthase MnmH [Celeribacter sp. PS-C1]|uniref:tRNA 2-selenouridine(34) synthase MnmH n=1 Tax=Celeribacter sp. PS-C1 TaxID=2820813 RepID=UPI001CA53884|nr:tRNA 2-selenouridine(34) synthase MnmH [Celeribacter sp. PS-C1]MBW6419402.1 tRNA 2-selenouridine(34) synthase MnmH [Celeribacter sp. PS-C1]
MSIFFSSVSDVLNAGFDTIIDVRAPSEFAEDHIPGAINLPVLDDAERARVGTIYTQQSPFLARKLGAALVARNAASHIEGPLAEKEGGWRPLVYCWRGGQRSNSFAIILRQIGWRVEVLDGGYKSWRRLVIGMLHDQALPHRLVLIDGNTGTAKTDLLHRVRLLGAQVLDLEGLAQHRGSIFGPMGEQPAQKGFESRLAEVLSRLDPARPVLVEAESSRIGEVTIPARLWRAMCSAPRIDVTAGLPSRARYLAEAYADLTEDVPTMQARLDQLIPLQGHARVKTWREMAEQGAFAALAEALMGQHYDPRYEKSRARHSPDVIADFDLGDLSVGARDEVAGRIVSLLNSCSN